VEKEWKGYGMQLLGLNLLNFTLMHKTNYLLFKQMSMLTHNNTQILIPHMNVPKIILTVNFLINYINESCFSHKGLKTRNEIFPYS